MTASLNLGQKWCRYADCCGELAKREPHMLDGDADAGRNFTVND